MTDHTDEPAGGDRTLTWLPIAAAAAVALVVGLVIVLAGPGDDNQLGSKRDSDGALVCPDSYQLYSDADKRGNGWVPVNPAGLDGKKRLVPDAAPEHVTVCRYVAKRAGTLDGTVTISLDGTRVLSGGQRAMTRELSAAPQAKDSRAMCLDAYERGNTSYLAGLTFRTGIVWVSVSGVACPKLSSNGQFVTSAYPAKQLAEAFDTNVWPTG